MSLRDLLPLVWANLRRARGRVALTAVGVTIGTAALLVLISLGAGLQRLSTEFTSGSDLTTIHLYPRIAYRVVQGAELAGMASADIPTRCGSPMDAEPIVDEAMRERFAALPGVAWVAVHETLLGAAEIEYGALRGSSVVRGVEPALLAQMGLDVARGAADWGRGEAVIGADFAAALYDPAQSDVAQRRSTPAPDLLGERLTLRLTTLDAEGRELHREVRVRVVGVLAPRGWLYDDGLFLLERDVVELNTWMHAGRAGQRRDPARQGYSGVIIQAADLGSTVAVEAALAELGFPVYTERQQLEEWAGFFTTLQLFLGGVGALALLVAAFGISNTMQMAIHERTHEIGLMKALGATHRDVTLIFLAESAGIGALGGAGGVLTGGLLVALMRLGGSIRLAGLPSTSAHVPPWLPLFAVSFAGLVGVVAGTYPARRAARLEPLIALKYE